VTKKKELDARLLDRRAVQRNIKKGYLTEDDLNSCNDALEDKAENAETCETSQAEFLGEREERTRQRDEARAARENALDNDIKIG